MTVVVSRFVLIAFAFVAATRTAEAADARAQLYPSKPIRLVAPFAPGGGTDILARIIGQKLAESLGQPVIVDNRTGASGIIGAEIVARASPDGYTLLMGSVGPNAIHASLYKKLPYDPASDFAAITLVGFVPNILVVHPSLPAKSVKELVALAKSQPGQLSFASAGLGSPAHLAGALLNQIAGINMVHIPYKGGAAAMPDVLAGQVPVMFPDLLLTLPHVRAGKLRGLAVTTAKRSSAIPELPTVAESGFPRYEVSLWYALIAPANTPAHIVSKLSSEVRKLLQTTSVKEQLAKQGAEPVGSTPEECAAYINSEIQKWKKVVRDADIRLE